MGDGFLGALPEEAAATFTDRDALEATLARHVGEGRAAWDGITHDDAAFVAHLARRLGSDATPATLAVQRGADVYLALACARGDTAAIARFEAAYFGEIARAGSRSRASDDVVAEVTSRLRRILFVSEEHRPAATAEFAGRGDLRGWMRVMATREVIAVLKRLGREVLVSDQTLFDVLSPTDDPELGYIRELYRNELQAAFRVALDEALTSKQRSLLRYQLVDGLSIDAIAAIHGTHRSTAARWLAEAREAIADRTRSELTKRLGVGWHEAESIIRLVRSRLELSLERLLGA